MAGNIAQGLLLSTEECTCFRDFVNAFAKPQNML